MSTPAERLLQVHQAFRVASDNRAGDLAQTTDATQAQNVLDNIDALHEAYFDAASGELAEGAAQVENAFKAASAANAEIDKARAAAEKIVKLIELTSQAASTVAQLVKVANGANP